MKIWEKDDWEKFRKNDCRDSIRADSKTNFFPKHEAFTKNAINENLDCLKKNLGVRRCYLYVARFIIAMTTNQTS